jgi:hypothetical protein
LFTGFGHLVRTGGVAAIGFDLARGCGHGCKSSLEMKMPHLWSAAGSGVFAFPDFMIDGLSRVLGEWLGWFIDNAGDLG